MSALLPILDDIIRAHHAITKLLVIPLAFASPSPYPKVLVRYYQDQITLRDLSFTPTTTQQNFLHECAVLTRSIKNMYETYMQRDKRTELGNQTVDE
jgi:hypothetical protein